MKSFKKLSAFAALCFAGFLAFAGKTSVENLYEYHFENGLTAFVCENHTVPLVKVELTVRTGAIDQTPETAGLFHLYEHLLFQANSLLKNSAEADQYKLSIGALGENGYTATDCVSYFFTVPKEKLEHALAYWNAAVRTPLMLAGEFENQKKVVLSEIEAEKSNPAMWAYCYQNEALFPEKPYKIHAGGSYEVVKNATVAQMRQIQREFYVPENSALFIGGDVNADETAAIVEKIFGSWQKSGFSGTSEPQLTQKPLSGPRYAVVANPKISEDSAYFDAVFRGPDHDFDAIHSYPLTYISYVLSDPASLLKTVLFKNSALQIIEPGNSHFSASTTRRSGTFRVGSSVQHPEDNLPVRAKIFSSEILENIFPALLKDSRVSSASTRKKILEMMDDEDEQVETYEDVLAGIKESWVLTGGSGYMLTFKDKVSGVSKQDIDSFIERYMIGAVPLVIVHVNPKFLEEQKFQFLSEGFEIITEESALWWKKSAFAADESKIMTNTAYVQDKNIFPLPAKTAATADVQDIPDVQVTSLKNGIPLYFRKTPGNSLSAGIIIRGGINHLTKETSGLESVLCDFMSSNSKKYSYEKRKKINYEKGISFSDFSRNTGSSVYVSGLAKNLPLMVDALCDGFMHPSFDKDFYENVMNDLRESVHYVQASPSSQVYYELSRQVTKGHPYEISSRVLPDSIGNITLDSLQYLHKRLLEEEIFVVVSGNAALDDIVDAFNKGLGKMKRKNTGPKALGLEHDEVPPFTIRETSPMTFKNATSSGTAYALRFHPIPDSTTREYLACEIAAKIHSDNLYNIVRTAKGACYTPSSFAVESKAAYAVDSIFKLSDAENCMKYVEEADSYMRKGLVISSINPDMTYSAVPLADVLEGYVNSYVSSTYFSKMTSLSQFIDLAYYTLQYNDHAFGNRQMAQIKTLTAKEITDAFVKYWAPSNSKWFVVEGNDVDVKFVER